MATSLAQLVAGFITVKYVLPADLGLWQSTKLAQTYAFLLLLGVGNGLSRELPFFLGKGDEGFCANLAGTVLFLTHAANGLVLIGGVGCAVGLSGRGTDLIFAIVAVTITIIVTFYQSYFIVAYRSKDAFKKLAGIQFVEAALSIATIPLVYYFRYEGMLVRTVLVSSWVVCLMYKHSPFQVSPRLNWRATALLFKTGLPIFALDYFRNSVGTLDRVCLLHYGGVETVGYYALATMTFQTLQVLPKSLAQYMYPRMTYQFGQHGNPRKLWGFGLKFSVLATALSTLCGVCVVLSLPHLVPLLAPKYARGLQAAEIIVLAGVMEGPALVANALWSMKAWRLMVSYQISSSILGVLGLLAGVVFVGPSLEGIAWGTVAGSVIRGALALGITYAGTRRGTVVRNVAPGVPYPPLRQADVTLTAR